jgi:hypothetical protein
MEALLFNINFSVFLPTFSFLWAIGRCQNASKNEIYLKEIYQSSNQDIFAINTD